MSNFSRQQMQNAGLWLASLVILVSGSYRLADAAGLTISVGAFVLTAAATNEICNAIRDRSTAPQSN
jgi:hypothetical protein